MELIHQITGIAIFVALTGLTVFLNVRKSLSDLMAAILLAFTLLSSWTVANQDWIRTVELRMPGMKSIENEVNRMREEAIALLLAESESRRKSLTELVAQVNTSREQLEQEKKALEKAMEGAQEFREKWEVRQNQLEELQESTLTAKEQMLAIHNTTADLALTLTRLIYLQLAGAPQEAGDQDRLKQHLLDGLDAVVSLAIPDPLAREAFVEDVIKSVPPRQ